MIRGCIFDLGGTLVDRYSSSSLHTIKSIFKENNVILSPYLISKGMGMNKRDHIQYIMNNP